MRVLAAPVILIVLSTTVVADDNLIINQQYENVSSEYAECAAYYRLVYSATQSSGEAETAQAYRQLEDSAMFYSLLLAGEGRTKDTAVEVTNSRIEMYLKKMKQEADNRNENISVLINKYHFTCQEAMETPRDAVTEAMARHAEELNQ